MKGSKKGCNNLIAMTLEKRRMGIRGSALCIKIIATNKNTHTQRLNFLILKTTKWLRTRTHTHTHTLFFIYLIEGVEQPEPTLFLTRGSLPSVFRCLFFRLQCPSCLLPFPSLFLRLSNSKGETYYDKEGGYD